MDLTTYSTGIQHIGIPTNDIETTIAFYHKLGFETAFETVNEEANERVAFLKLGTLVIETYENKSAKLESGAIDHVGAIHTAACLQVGRHPDVCRHCSHQDVSQTVRPLCQDLSGF